MKKIKIKKDENGRWWGKVVKGLLYIKMENGKYYCSKNYKYLDE